MTGMRLFPFHATHAARDRVFDVSSGDELLAAVHDYIDCRFEAPFDQWIRPDLLGAHACDIRAQGATWTAISAEFNHVPLWVVMAWLLEHRLTEHAKCYWCLRRPWWRLIARITGRRPIPTDSSVFQ